MSGDECGRRRHRLVVGGVVLEVLSDAAPSLDDLGLSEVEREVARLVVAGATTAEIAERRGTSPRTVEKQIAACLRRLGVRSRAELIVRLHGEG